MMERTKDSQSVAKTSSGPVQHVEGLVRSVDYHPLLTLQENGIPSCQASISINEKRAERRTRDIS